MPARRPSSPVPLSVADRIEAGLARGLGRLPEGVLSRLVGPPTEIDGQRLDPSVQLILRLERFSRHPSFETLPLQEARAEVEREARVFRGAPIELPGVRELEVAGAEGPLPARLYVARGGRRPLAAARLPARRRLGRGQTSTRTTSPAASSRGRRECECCRSTTGSPPSTPSRPPSTTPSPRSAHADRSRRSASEPIRPRSPSAATARAATWPRPLACCTARDGGPVPAFQLLIYPVTDLSRKRPQSYRAVPRGLLPDRDARWTGTAATTSPDEPDASDPRVSPLLAVGPGRAAARPTSSRPGFDVLRDEGEAYAARLRDAGVHVTHTREPGLIHGFINAVGVSPAPRALVRRMAQPLRAALAAT